MVVWRWYAGTEKVGGPLTPPRYIRTGAQGQLPERDGRECGTVPVLWALDYICDLMSELIEEYNQGKRDGDARFRYQDICLNESVRR
jgi:hypothetical protein